MGEVTPTATNKMERAMHQKFGSSRLNGEWFRYKVRLVMLLVLLSHLIERAILFFQGSLILIPKKKEYVL